MNIAQLRNTESTYPAGLLRYLRGRAPERIFALGNLDILQTRPLAFFCSEKCPGNLILKTYDLARELRDAKVAVISGFHSPMERECFSVLLRGEQPVIWCLARRLAVRRTPREYAAPLADGRLLLLSPFSEKITRATEKTALFRNVFVAALAERIFVAHAVHGSKTEALCRKVLDWRKPLLTFDVPENAALIESGANVLDVQNVAAAFRAKRERSE